MPWGTPLVTSEVVDLAPFAITTCVLSERKLCIQIAVLSHEVLLSKFDEEGSLFSFLCYIFTMAFA